MTSEQRGLAPYASHGPQSRGRLLVEDDGREATSRSPFQRDRDRIIHSGAFRRLKHKTQVFVYHEGDYFRTRLTHSLEVAQIARSMARPLRLNDDLAESVALAHDLGHTPFGHAGEDALNRAMQNYGGFDHNDQTIRVLTHLEQRYAGFNGLNLSWETIEGVVKHNGLITGPATDRNSIAMIDQQFHLELTDAVIDSYVKDLDGNRKQEQRVPKKGVIGIGAGAYYTLYDVGSDKTHFLNVKDQPKSTAMGFG